MISVFETFFKDAPQRQHSLGSSSQFLKYLEKIKSEREQSLGKQETMNINPIQQHGKISQKEM